MGPVVQRLSSSKPGVKINIILIGGSFSVVEKHFLG